MTPLEAARVLRMAAQPARNQNTGQAACCGTPPTAPHVPGCAWLMWDQIVAALEAVSAVVAVMKIPDVSEAEDEAHTDLLTAAMLMLAAKFEGKS